MSPAVFTVDPAEILSELRRVRLLAVDPYWARELSSRVTNGTRIHYFRASGALSIDAALQHFQGLGMVRDGVDAPAFISALEQAFFDRSHGSKPKREKKEARAEKAAAERGEKQAQNRLRRHECPRCGITVYHGGDSTRAACLCVLADHPELTAILEAHTFEDKPATKRPISGAALASMEAKLSATLPF